MQNTVDAKVLVIRFSSIGDIVLCTPVIRALKTQLKAEVHWLTKRSMAQVLEHNPHVDKIYTIDSKVDEVIEQLKGETYDYIIDLHKNLRSRKTIAALKKPHVSFNKLSWQRSLYVYTKIDLLPEKSIVDRMYEGVSTLGIENDGQGMEYHYGPIREEQFDFLEKNAYSVIALGATHATKRMTPAVIRRFIKNIDLPIVLIGGNDTSDLVEQVIDRPDKNIYNLVGKTTLHESAYLTNHCAYIITGDSAMMHIAAAFKKPIIAVWGSTSPRFGFYPYYGDAKNQAIYLEQKISCRPCTKQGRSSCPKGHYNCMNHSEDDIIDALRRIQFHI